MITLTEEKVRVWSRLIEASDSGDMQALEAAREAQDRWLPTPIMVRPVPIGVKAQYD